MPKLIITGSKGRMGKAVIRCASTDPEFTVIGAVDLGDSLGSFTSEAEVIIDFSFHDATRAIAEKAAEHRKALVIGTTGHTEADRMAIEKLTATVPTVWASNFSTGVNTLFWLTRKAAEILGTDFDLEVIEMHHRQKQDAPSGTASTLTQILSEVRNLQPESDLCHGRNGIVGPRSDREIGVHAVRGGDVVGDHTVFYAAQGERLELTHRATSRDTFAKGALRAAKWLLGRPAGLYTMQHVLGLEP